MLLDDMLLARKAALLLATIVVVSAPLACLRFCELQHVLAQQQPSWLAEMARLHALGLDQRRAQQLHQHADGHDMPLSRVRELVTSVTEFVLAEGGLSAGVLALLWTFALLLRSTQPILCVPKPPPRRSPAFYNRL